MTFAKPAYLFSLLLLPLLILFLVWTKRQRKAALARLGDPTLIGKLLGSLHHYNRRWKTVLYAGGLALLLFSLARPQWGQQVQAQEGSGLQVMIVLDVSASMLAQDLQPDRLTRAKAELSELLAQMDGGEVGLVPFSGAAFIQLPLTGDLDTAARFLDAAGPAVISRPGSEISAALQAALNGFDPARARQKIMLLVSDGETPNEDVLAAAQTAGDEGVRIYTLGLGTTDGALVPEYNTAGEQIGYKRTVSGETVVSRLDEALLQGIAEAGGGRYYHIGGADAASSLAAEFRRLQSAETLAQIESLPVERFQLFLLPAWLLLLASILLPERRTRQGDNP